MIPDNMAQGRSFFKSSSTFTKKTSFEALKEGFSAPWKGFVYMCRRPFLWRYAIIPTVLNILITILVVGGMFFAYFKLLQTIHPKFSSFLMEVISAILLLILMIGLIVAFWMLLGGILCGHFYGKLAKQIELQLGTRPEDLKEIPFHYQVIDSVKDMAMLLSINLSCLVLNIVPGLGATVSFYFDCLIFGEDYLDFPMSLRGFRRKEKRSFIRQHRAHTVGLGMPVFIFTFIPVLGSILLTSAVTGAVLLYHHLKKESHIETPIDSKS